jgi:hypothetical protein
MVEHDHPVDDSHQHAHDVLDPDDGDAELAPDTVEHVGGALHLGMVEPAQALIRQQQPRPRGEGARELELFELRRAEAGGGDASAAR